MVLEDDLQCLYSCSQAIRCALFGLPHAPPKNPMIFGGWLHVEESVRRLARFLACIEGKPVSLFGDVKETAAAAASELQRERKENVFSSVRASSALVSPSVRVRPIIIVILVAGWRGLGGSLPRRVVMCLPY